MCTMFWYNVWRTMSKLDRLFQRLRFKAWNNLVKTNPDRAAALMGGWD